MAKLKTRTNQPVNDSEGLLDHVAQKGNTTEVGGNLEVDGDVKLNSDLEVDGNVKVNGDLEVDGKLPATIIYRHTLIVSQEDVNYIYYVYSTLNKEYTSYTQFANDVKNIIACHLLSATSAHTYTVMIYTDGTGSRGYYIDYTTTEIAITPLPAPNASIVSDFVEKL